MKKRASPCEDFVSPCDAKRPVFQESHGVSLECPHASEVSRDTHTYRVLDENESSMKSLNVAKHHVYAQRFGIKTFRDRAPRAEANFS